MTPVPHHQYVFNVVWTGEVFHHLQLFVASLIEHSDAQFRFVANACPPGQIDAMERFAARHPGRVVEVVEVSSQVMLRHGEALDEVFRTRDDGELFCLIDPDIQATGPFLAMFDELLAHHDAVTSGKEVWSDHNIRPEAHPGVNGEYFFDQDGYVFGSPHLAVYRRAALVDTLQRWGVGFGSTGKDLPDAARDRLAEAGRGYWVYDTAKVVNILLQEDGHPLCHQEHPDLLHIGGVSHFLAPPSSAPATVGKPPRWGEGPDWGQGEGMAVRFEVARYTSAVLQELCDGRPAPEIPAGVESSIQDRLERVQAALIDLVHRYGPPTTTAPEPAR